MTIRPTRDAASPKGKGPTVNRPKKRRTIAVREGLAGRLFTLPTIITLVGLVLYPIVYGFLISLFDTNLINRWDFVGLDNYARVATKGTFFESVGTTFIFAALVVGGNMIVGIVLAVLINRPIRFRLFFRGVLILPWLFPEVVVALIWKWMYNPLYGLFNGSLQAVGLQDEPVAWLDDPNLALLAVAGAAIWKGYPLVMILVLAGLQTIPKELYEAAAIDGAGFVRSFRHVTIPRLRPVLLAVVVLETIWWFKHFTIVWLMTSGGPVGATTLVSIEIFQRSFVRFQWGPAAAAAVLVLFIVIAISAIYRKVLRDKDE